MKRLKSILYYEVPRTAMILVFAIMALNLWDGFCTLRHLEYGAEELNPLMKKCIQVGPVTFIGVKHLLISVCTSALTLQWNEKGARIAMWTILGIFISIAIWQVFCFTVIQ